MESGVDYVNADANATYSTGINERGTAFAEAFSWISKGDGRTSVSAFVRSKNKTGPTE